MEERGGGRERGINHIIAGYINLIVCLALLYLRTELCQQKCIMRVASALSASASSASSASRGNWVRLSEIPLKMLEEVVNAAN